MVRTDLYADRRHHDNHRGGGCRYAERSAGDRALEFEPLPDPGSVTDRRRRRLATGRPSGRHEAQRLRRLPERCTCGNQARRRDPLVSLSTGKKHRLLGRCAGLLLFSRFPRASYPEHTDLSRHFPRIPEIKLNIDLLVLSIICWNKIVLAMLSLRLESQYLDAGGRERRMLPS